VIITDLEIDGFGAWTAVRLPGVSDRLNVIYGPNEAGKTTLLQFIRAALYGFADPARRRYVPPVGGGRAGGSVCLTSGGGRYRVARHVDERSDGPPVEVLTLTTADGLLRSDDLLPNLLHGIDESTFQNVFAVGLDEIQELGTLDGTAAARLLYDLTTGLDRVSLGEVMRELGALRLTTWGGPELSSDILRLHAERARLRRELDELGDLTGEYGRLTAERAALLASVERLQQEQATLQRAVRVVEAATHLREKWQERSQLAARLEALGDVRSVPADAVGQLDLWNRRGERTKKQLTALAQQRQELAAKVKGLGINLSLWRNAPRIAALTDQQEWLSTLERQVGEFDRELADLRGQLEAERKRAGLTDPKTGAAIQPLSQKAMAELRSLARDAHQARERFDSQQREIRQTRASAEDLSRRASAALAEIEETDVVSAVEKQGTLVTLLRRRLQAEERLEQAVLHEQELDQHSADLIERQLLPVGSLVGLGAMFVFGVVLILAGCFLPVGSSGWLMALLGVAAAVGAVIAKQVLESKAAGQLESAERQLATVRTQIQQLKGERSELDAQLPTGGGPITVRLQTAERRLAQLEEMLPVEASRKAAEQDSAAAVDRTRDAKRELIDARRRWQESLAAQGWPAEATPRQVLASAKGARRLREIERRIERQREQREQAVRSRQALLDRIQHVATEAGVTLPDAGAAECLRQLRQEVAAQEALTTERDQILDQMRKFTPRRAKLRGRLARVDRERRKLLRGHGAGDDDEFRRLAQRWAERTRLAARRDELAREIATGLPRGSTEDDLREQLEGQHEHPLETRWESLAARLQACENELRSGYEKRGQLNASVEALGSDARFGQRALDLEMVEARLAQATERWQVLAATGRVLESVRGEYERDRQPETLREATGHLKKLTDGQYARIWTPLCDDVLYVDPPQGQALAVEVLSRGTREQLFLSLRMALASAYARRGAPLPLILDDVFVNFDDRRAQQAVKLLIDYAEQGRQVFVFTCHEHIARMFLDRQVPVLDLETRQWMRPDGAEQRRKRRVEHVPAPEPVAPPAPIEEPAPPPPLPVLEIIAAAPAPPPPPVPEVAAPPLAALAEVEPQIVEPLPPAPQPILSEPPPAPHLAEVAASVMPLGEPVALAALPPAAPPTAPAVPRLPVSLPSDDLDDEVFVPIADEPRLPARLVAQVRKPQAVRTWEFFTPGGAEEFAGEFAERPPRVSAAAPQFATVAPAQDDLWQEEPDEGVLVGSANGETLQEDSTPVIPVPREPALPRRRRTDAAHILPLRRG
jgi:uncharacterized protein YhaN